MKTISLPDLQQARYATVTIEFQESLPDLETLMPVQGSVRIAHQGTYLEVSGQAETIVTLTCDRCLQQYNYRLKIQPKELIWLQSELVDEWEEEREVPMEDLVDSIDPDGDFDPMNWIYEQLCLAMPYPKHCRSDCPGVEVETPDTGAIDQRWAALQNLQKQLRHNS